MRKTNEGKYAAVTGTIGYRWMESEDVKRAGMTDAIDRSYYDKLVDEAVEDLSIYGDVEWFTADEEAFDIDPLAKYMNIPVGAKEETPFEELVPA